jgi:geranylgeranyl pyrophosphate synthase
VLDCTASAETLGKTPGKDEKQGKLTYPALFGLEVSRKEAEAQARDAEQTLLAHGLPSEVMGGLARFAVSRSR